MNRLTIEQIKQFPLTTYGRMIGKQLAAQVMRELTAYKQIEEELGVDLITLLNMMKGWTKYIKIVIDTVNKERCFAAIMLVVPTYFISQQIYSTTKYDEVVVLEKLQKILAKEI